MPIDSIKELRDLTGLSFNEIKKALEESGGDKGKALELLKTRGASIAAKKSERSTGEGIIETYVHGTKKIGVMLELLCETDFVARNAIFSELAHELALHIAASAPVDVAELMSQEFIKDPSKTIQALITESIAKIGENIKVSRFIRYQI